MRQRLRRAGWWIRRFRGKRFGALIAAVLIAAGAAWVYGGSDAAAVGAAAVLATALVLVGMALAGPIRAVSRRLFLRNAPWRTEPGPLSFAGADLGFMVVGRAGGLSPREEVDAVSSAGGRFSSGEVTLQLWLVASDQDGRDWIVVQEEREIPFNRLTWTCSVEGELTIADFDGTGRPNPFRAAHRLVKEELDVPLVDIELLGWGTEEGEPGDRDTVVAFARTSLAAEQLSGFDYPGERARRSAHLVALDLDGVAKTLGWGHPGDWRGGAAFGLLELLEMFQPGAWAVLERRVAPRWHDKGMFARLERGTRAITERAGLSRSLAG